MKTNHISAQSRKAFPPSLNLSTKPDQLHFLRVVLGVLAACSLSVSGALAHPPFGDAIITNGVVQMGIHQYAHLNVPGGTPSSGTGTTFVGLRYVPTQAEATAPGCHCEGWGVADAGTAVTGSANEDVPPFVSGLTPISFAFTPTTAVSVVEIGTTFRVTHDYHPSASPNLYESVVTIQNISGSALTDVRYRRVMDWDIEPTAFSEFVTIQTGTASALLFSSDNGFATADPLVPGGSILFTGEFVDSGPADHGALFDFGFGGLAAGASKTFKIFYGASGTEAEALAALTVVGAEVYSLGQPNTVDGPTLGTPNTFIFAFAGVGGEVDIDIKPGSDPNSIKLSNRGVIAVAILSTTTFDATTVDPSTVCFGDAEDPTQRDCTEAHGTGHIEDVNGDGLLDLVLHYETGETGIDFGDTQACLTGQTFGGQLIAGCDSVRTLDP